MDLNGPIGLLRFRVYDAYSSRLNVLRAPHNLSVDSY